MKGLEERITALETSIVNDPAFATLPLTQKVLVYRILTRSHVDYIEAVRKMCSTVDVDRMLKSLGLLELVDRLKKMSPDSITKITGMLESVDGSQ